MKQIIDGKRYDTETATKLAHWWNGCSTTDFNCVSEDLYKTKAGTFFLHGTGGALSGWSCSYEGGRSRGGGSGLRPLTNDEARQWLEDHELTEAIETHFAGAIVDA
jgi:hypothetical protein